MFNQANFKQNLLVLLVGASGWLFGFVIYNTAIAAVYNYLDLQEVRNDTVDHLDKLQGVNTQSNGAWFTHLVIPESNSSLSLDFIEWNDPRRQVIQARDGDNDFYAPLLYWIDYRNLPVSQFRNLKLGMELFLKSSNGSLSRYQVINMEFGGRGLKELVASGSFQGLIIMTELPGELFGSSNTVAYAIYVEPVASFYT